MKYRETKNGPVVPVKLNHPTYLPVYNKVANYQHHPMEGPPIALISGGSGARALSQELKRYTHNSSHVLPMFDDGGSSAELREKLHMPPPGDLRNRLMALSDMTMSGNPEVSRLFNARLPTYGTSEELQEELDNIVREDNPQMARIEQRYRQIIVRHLDRFNRSKPADFNLRGGNIGNFVIAGSYLSIGDLESVIFEFSALAAVRGEVYPVCVDGDFHLYAEFTDGSAVTGESRITSASHPPIQRLAIMERRGDRMDTVTPEVNPLAAKAISKAALIAYSMGSFYTSIVASLLVDRMGKVIRETARPKVLVANLRRDNETPNMTVSAMLKELWQYLRLSDPGPGRVKDYVQYVLVGTHGDCAHGGRVPVDLEEIKRLGVEPIILPLERDDPEQPGLHDAELVAATLISLC